MKEYMYTDLECLRDMNGDPVRVYVPKDEIEDYNEIAKRARESGARLRQALKEEGVIE